MQGIYKIKNTINNFSYIGSSKDIKRRFRNHKYFLRANKHGSIYLQRSWNKYGENNFIFEILETVDLQKDLENREQYHIDNTKCLYNLCKTAGNTFGYKHTEETKRKISESNKGKVLSNEVKNKISKALKGRKLSKEVRKKISISKKGKLKKYSKDFIEKATERILLYKGSFKNNKHSDDSKLKMSLSQKGKKQSEETKLKRAKLLYKSILQYDKNMNFIKEWESIKEASEVLNIRRTFISSVLTNIKKSAKGFIFKYKKNNNEL